MQTVTGIRGTTILTNLRRHHRQRLEGIGRGKMKACALICPCDPARKYIKLKRMKPYLPILVRELEREFDRMEANEAKLGVNYQVFAD